MEIQSHTKCPPVSALADLFLETPTKALSEDEHAQIFRHLESCAQCQAVCDSLLDHDSPETHPTLIGHATIDLQVQGVIDVVKGRFAASPDMVHVVDTLPDRSESQPTPDFGGEYEIVRKLGSGAQGVVYLARDIQLDRNVVIKTLLPQQLTTPEALERFKREAKSAARVRGEHVVPIHRISVLPQGSLYLVMEYVEGATLREYLRHREVNDFRMVARLARQIALGLVSVHEQSVIHRDIKPENILIERRTGLARLADFGLAIDSAEESRITTDGMLAGTPAYMSPEQVVAPQSVDQRSDIYSLGVVLYELLTGDVPFRGTARMTMMQVAHEEPKPPRSYNDLIPIDLQTICLRAMSKDPAKRFPSAKQLEAELERYLNGQPIESRPIGRIERAWRWAKRNVAISALVGTVGVLLTLLASISTFAAVRFSILNQRATQSAADADQQRNAAFQTLEQLVFELQKRFDSEDIDIDEVQQNTLHIALRGMEKMTRMAGSTPQQTLATAVALCHLGETFHNLENDDSAKSCLVKADSLLRELLRQRPDDQSTLVAFVDTVFAMDDCMIESDVEALAARYEDVNQRCRHLYEKNPSEELKIKFAEGLARESVCRLELRQLGRAKESLNQAQSLLKSMQSKDALDNDKALLFAFVQIEEAYAELLTLQGRKSEMKRRAQDVVSLLIQLSPTSRSQSDVWKCELSLMERLGCFEEANTDSFPAEILAAYQSLRSKLISGAATDSWELREGTLVTATLANQRMGLELFGSARHFLNLRSEICEKRLSQVNDDGFALVELADSHVALAGLDTERRGSKSKRSLRDHCDKAMICYERLIQLKQYKDIDWSTIQDALLYLLEDRSQDAKRLRSAWASKVQSWISDPTISEGVDPSELTLCLETIKEIEDQR
jgi:serine/threonine protein kinase